MSLKVETNSVYGTYDLSSTHDEIVDIFNSDSMALGGTPLEKDQVFEILVEQVSTGKQRLLLSHFREGSNLIIRLRKSTLEAADTDIGNIIIEA